jgi:hydrogenase nickel incorporation protein HypB
MCQDCGCGDPDIVPIEIQQRILSQNDVTAQHNREHFEAAGILALNLMGSPGSGKTAILEATARLVGDRLRLGAVSGDLATDNDEKRLRKAGIPSGTITTGQSCHLDARLVHECLHDFNDHKGTAGLDVFVIENVGNLVCPAIYDLGEAVRVVALSVTEGEDKPIKYPVMFQHADLVLITKCDLIPHLDVDIAAIHDALARVMPKPNTLLVSARTGEGIDQFIRFLEEKRAGLSEKAAAAARSGGAAHTHSHSAGHSHQHPHGAS